MTNDDFNAMRRHVRRICGIELGDDKSYLIEQRFSPMAEARGFKSMAELVHLIEGDAGGNLRDEIIQAITTNETSFFRDEHPFEAFRAILLPELIAVAEERAHRAHVRKGAKVSILSAGASTGQEAYCLSMLINDRFPFASPGGINAEDFVIHGIDIDPQVLAKAMSGEYTDAEVARGLPDNYRDRYFLRKGRMWSVNDKVRELVEFRRVNLTEMFTFLGGFDCIFCRNILIYFDLPTKIRILEQFHQMLGPNGILVLGSTESLYGLNGQFESCHAMGSIFYRKKSDAPPPISSGPSTWA